ncbi:MAG: histone-lysine N-methyltransferase [Nitrospirae bacterium]|nr:histone-lysine N-methyltransferase [Nitrospirota bacterium]
MRECMRFEVQDIAEANLYREYFPYSEVPRLPFNHRVVPMEIPADIFITDTTFRDGQQSRPPYTAAEIADIFDFLHRMSGPNGVIRQSEFFLYSDKDKEAVRLCMERGYKFPEVTGWIRAVKKDFQLVKEMGLKETGILVSCSDYHMFLKLNMTRKQAMESYLDVVRAALDAGVRPRCHFEDITRADFFGFVIPFAQELMRLSEESKIPIKIRACDTMGYGVPYVGAALPRGVPEIIYTLRHYAGVPSELLEWHGHNDFHKGLINATTSWLYGCSSANGALLGFGERTGNTPVEALLIEYISLTGSTNGIDTTAINDMAAYFRKKLKVHIPTNYPFVGDDFNNTAAGIHADGVLKNEEIYNIFDTTKILNRPMGVIITDKSGVAGIAYWANNFLGLTGSGMVDKRHPGIAKIHKWVMDQYAEGRTTNISRDEMAEKVKKYLPEYMVSDLDVMKVKARDIAVHLVEGLVEGAPFKKMDKAGMEKAMQGMLDDNPFIQFAYVVNTDAKKVTKNITQIVDRAAYEHFGLDDDFADRGWFIGPMKDGQSHVTNFYTSKVTGALAITVSTPIRDKEDNIVGVLGIDIKFEDLVKAE